VERGEKGEGRGLCGCDVALEVVNANQNMVLCGMTQNTKDSMNKMKEEDDKKQRKKNGFPSSTSL
jgi:hypothetical protein